MNSDVIISALEYFGVREIAGEEDNAELIKMAQEAGFTTYEHDDMAWCSMFANYIAKKLGYRASNSLSARSWLKVGQSVESPVIGDVCVLWRLSPQSWKGHVAFFIRQDASSVYLLGGNQNDSVSIQQYPKNRLLGFRRLVK